MTSRVNGLDILLAIADKKKNIYQDGGEGLFKIITKDRARSRNDIDNIIFLE